MFNKTKDTTSLSDQNIPLLNAILFLHKTKSNRQHYTRA
uniref:Uncharacterized protein n=1 Tax=Anguilla anguilla TaxID=7936 RepID=A0A0E9RQT8_ANGAN